MLTGYSSRLLATVLLATIATACTPSVRGPKAKLAIPGVSAESQVYTLTNLHPDDPRPLLWAKNYLRAGLIPVCTPVTVTGSHRSAIWFRIPGSKTEYRYQNHKTSNPRPFPEHLAKVFGPACPKDELARLGDVDRRHVEAGTVGPGMTKKGVILAIGYPPEVGTPDLEASKWTYWRSRVRSFDVVFGDDGRVATGELPPLHDPARLAEREREAAEKAGK